MKAREIENYTKSYPKLERRWINQCIACQRKGYSSDMPENIYPGFGAQHLRSYFEPLEVDETGLCGECSLALQVLNP